MADIKRKLKDIITEKRAQKMSELEARTELNERDRKEILTAIQNEIANAVAPIIAAIPEMAKLNAQEMRAALLEAVRINMPEVKIPDIKVDIPETKIPDIKLPDITIDTTKIEEAIDRALKNIVIPAPIVNVPETQVHVPDRMKMDMDMVTREQPLPVLLMDTQGRPFQFSFPAATGGGKSDFFTIKGFGENALLPTSQVSGAIWSVEVTNLLGGVLGPGEDDEALRVVMATDGIASTQTKLVSRQTNPTATADGSSVFASADDLGRTLVRPVQVRDLIATAYVSITTGVETTLLAGAAGTFHDIIYLMGANQSDAAVILDVRSGTAGSVVLSLEIPPEATAGASLPVPIPQTEAAQAWTVQNAGSDVSGTSVDVSALFSKEV